jgi:hypothetical protein
MVGMQHIIGMPQHITIIGIPIAMHFIMFSQHSFIISMVVPSIGAILHIMPSLVISMVILHIIGGFIIGMGIIIGIMFGMPIIDGIIMLGIIVPIICGIIIVGIMPGIIEGIIMDGIIMLGIICGIALMVYSSVNLTGSVVCLSCEENPTRRKSCSQGKARNSCFFPLLEQTTDI